MLTWSRGLQGFAWLLCCLVDSEGSVLGQVKDTATYRERLALPPEAVFEATLEDVSKADAPAEVMGQVRIEQPDNPPFQFEITYDPARIIASHRYVVRARILVGDKLFFVTDRSEPVLTGGHSNEVALLLRRAGSSGPRGGTDGPLGLCPRPLPAISPVPIAPAFAISWSCFRTRRSSYA